ncbi:host specificity protein J [Escherichia coli]|uniref:host specificity protein J n=1 Tax=Escherichia coli TaxID=562 RepID=UPI00388EBA1F
MGLKLPTLRQRLFRCVSIRENDDGIVAPSLPCSMYRKEAIVDNGRTLTATRAAR